MAPWLSTEEKDQTRKVVYFLVLMPTKDPCLLVFDKYNHLHSGLTNEEKISCTICVTQIF
jgi:hypothetical protein